MMEEQFRLEEERTVACLQRITEEKTQAVERVFSLEVRGVSLSYLYHFTHFI